MQPAVAPAIARLHPYGHSVSAKVISPNNFPKNGTRLPDCLSSPPGRPITIDARTAMKARMILIAATFFAASTPQARAQSIASPADSALNACAAAADAGDETLTAQHADRADKLFDQLISSRPADGLAGKARVISQCRLPFTAMMRKIGLLDESNALLERALAADSMHFGARFTLSLNHYHVPEMFGRTADATRQLEKLVALYGTRPIPNMATVYLYLGNVYMRTGRKADAIAAWRRGQELHPQQNAAFMEALKNAGAAASTEPETETPDDPKTAATLAPVYEMDALVVEAGRFS